jgi:hypothetical protein
LFLNLRSRPSRLSWRSRRWRLIDALDGSSYGYSGRASRRRGDTATDEDEQEEAESPGVDGAVGIVEGDGTEALDEPLLPLLYVLPESIRSSARRGRRLNRPMLVPSFFCRRIRLSSSISSARRTQRSSSSRFGLTRLRIVTAPGRSLLDDDHLVVAAPRPAARSEPRRENPESSLPTRRLVDEPPAPASRAVVRPSNRVVDGAPARPAKTMTDHRVRSPGAACCTYHYGQHAKHYRSRRRATARRPWTNGGSRGRQGAALEYSDFATE